MNKKMLVAFVGTLSLGLAVPTAHAGDDAKAEKKDKKGGKKGADKSCSGDKKAGDKSCSGDKKAGDKSCGAKSCGAK